MSITSARTVNLAQTAVLRQEAKELAITITKVQGFQQIKTGEFVVVTEKFKDVLASEEERIKNESVGKITYCVHEAQETGAGDFE